MRSGFTHMRGATSNVSQEHHVAKCCHYAQRIATHPRRPRPLTATGYFFAQRGSKVPPRSGILRTQKLWRIGRGVGGGGGGWGGAWKQARTAKRTANHSRQNIFRQTSTELYSSVDTQKKIERGSIQREADRELEKETEVER